MSIVGMGNIGDLARWVMKLKGKTEQKARLVQGYAELFVYVWILISLLLQLLRLPAFLTGPR